ncbi:MAG: SIMPL domain-containing protein [Patescibacteria group bacterium]|nr:SIMPL domain-containing protein [Patescibacteria group bacterium]
MLNKIVYILTGVVCFFVLLFIWAKFAAPIPLAVSSVTTTKTDTFNVTGEGKVSAVPDMATISVGITANASTVRDVQGQINQVINQITDAEKKLGLTDKEIQTQNYSINPQYNFQVNPQKITGYTASTSLQLKVNDLGKLNEVIDTATANGANSVGAISFDVKDKTKAQDEARQQAVAEAKAKAQAAAQAAGFNLGRLVNYSESNNNIRPVPLAMGTAEKSDTSSVTSVQPGSTEIDLTVTLSYEIQ